jgi:hypothetical protein
MIARMRGAVLWTCVIGLAGASCSFNSAGVAPGGDSSDAAVTGGDARTIDANPTAPDAPPSTPDGCVPGCDSNGNLDNCAGGVQLCDLGCSAVGGLHCEHMVPSNGATESDLVGVTAGLAADATRFVFPDTDTGTIYISNGQNNFTQIRGPGAGVVDGIAYRVTAGGIAIFAIDSLDLAGDGYMRPYGSKPVIFLARGAVTISGLLDMSGGCTTPTTFDRACAGPGGGTGGKPGTNGGPIVLATGCGPGGNGTHTTNGPDAGAGGGGMAIAGGAGGAGGATGVTVAGGAGGGAGTCVGPTLVPLNGGGGGGMGGNGAVGGGGGGAIQISSFTSITISTDPAANASAQLDAAGRGGQGSATSGAGGAGAGGAILLEAPAITIDGNVTANGGGGGSGRVSANTGAKGSSTSATPAAGGAGDALGGAGGDGGAGVIPPTAGGGMVDGGGGGGGAYGRIRFNVPAAALSTTVGALVSPAAVRGDLGLQ